MRKISLVEKILRTGSEGNLIKEEEEKQPQQVQPTDVLHLQRAPILKGKALFFLS